MYPTEGTQNLSWGRIQDLSRKPGSDKLLGTVQPCTAVFAVILAALAAQPYVRKTFAGRIARDGLLPLLSLLAALWSLVSSRVGFGTPEARSCPCVGLFFMSLGKQMLDKMLCKCSAFRGWVELAELPLGPLVHGRKKPLQSVSVKLDVCWRHLPTFCSQHFVSTSRYKLTPKSKHNLIQWRASCDDVGYTAVLMGSTLL